MTTVRSWEHRLSLLIIGVSVICVGIVMTLIPLMFVGVLLIVLPLPRPKIEPPMTPEELARIEYDLELTPVSKSAHTNMIIDDIDRQLAEAGVLEAQVACAEKRIMTCSPSVQLEHYPVDIIQPQRESTAMFTPHTFYQALYHPGDRSCHCFECERQFRTDTYNELQAPL